MRLAKMTYAYAACTVCVTIFSTGGKFWPISKFTELHGLIPATRSYALLLKYINHWVNSWAYLDAPLQVLPQRQHQIGFEFPNDKSHNYNFPMQYHYITSITITMLHVTQNKHLPMPVIARKVIT